MRLVTPPSDPVAPVTDPVRPLPSAATASPGILGLGAYIPDRVISNADLARLVETSDSWILERTGIRERRQGGSGETTSMMATAAARAALESAGSPAIDGIVVATASPDTLFPNVACLVQRRLGLPEMPCFDISAACSGFVYGLAVADALVRAGRAERLLLIGAEAMTTLVDYGDRATCILFGDAAGAAVVGAGTTGGVRAVWWGSDGRDADIIHYGPDPATGAPAAVRMLGKGTFRLAVERMTEAAQQLCRQAGWTIDQVDHVVPHQANLRIIDAVAKRLGARSDQIVVNGDRYGNTSAATIPVALAEAQAAGRLRRGDKVILVAFGAGATWGGVALEWAMG